MSMGTDVDEQTKEKRRLGRQLGPLGVLAGAAALLPPVGGLVVLGTLDVVGPWLADRPAVGLMLYVTGFVVFAGLALLPTYAQAVLGGWAFGFVWGYPAALVGFVGASWLGYAVASRFARPGAQAAIDERPQWRAIQRAFLGQGFWRTTVLVALVRLPPVSPFAMTNMVLAGAGVGRGAYLLGTLAGMAPRTGLAVFAAAGVAQWREAEMPGDWVYVLGAAATVVVLIVLTWIGRRAMRTVKEAGAGEG
ncbi:TVP38/TMEM64 family protein [Phycisphaerales bacterium AB-hyl4]|uniref:TVP38/TMEM64 family membrane protein n=1 Tax=Natronomicrosphaera hydrolytica TaxID=3242702 RepID=A0ABV4U7P3_9BACT